MSLTITGNWNTLTQADFEKEHKSGGWFHFRFSSIVRTQIAALAATHGWPLIGIFWSGSGDTPSYALHVSEFPTNAPKKADRQQDDIDGLMQAIVETEEQDDSGGSFTGRPFHAVCHMFNYTGTGGAAGTPEIDYKFKLTVSPPDAQWWEE